MDETEQILRLQCLFRGNARVIGQASNDLVPDKNGKLNQSKRGFAPGPATTEHWQNHLRGVKSLGLVPITDYSQCKFMAIDVDLDIMESLKVTLASIAASVEANDMPLVVCRSKSGAAHLYCFLNDETPVPPVRRTLIRMGDYMGFSSERPCEYFPHTNKLDTTSNGKYINLPYFDAENTVRYAIDHLGNELSLDEFIALAESKVTTPEKFCKWKLPDSEADSIRDVIVNGPPCLQTIYDQGLQPGTKNDMLFQFALLFKKYNPNTYEDNVEIINQTRTGGAPHDSSDLSNTLKSLRKKSYQYSCSHPCMAKICAKGLCQTRKYGIKAAVECPPIKEILQWGANDEYFEIIFESGDKVKILCSLFLEFGSFRAAIVQALHIVIPEPKRLEWQDWITTIIATKVKRVDVPKEFNVDHSICSLIISYITGRTVGSKIEELMVSKPVKIGEDIYVRQKDIQAEIVKRRFPGYVENLELSVVVNDLKGYMSVKEIDGHIVPVFVIPNPKINQEELMEKVAVDFEPKY